MALPKIDGTGHGIPRMCFFSDGSNWYAALIDSAGHLQIDVVTSALPTDAAKETKQDTMITALQLIDDLRNALDSVGTDELDVNVEGYDPVPSSPLVYRALDTAWPSGTNTDIVVYNVPAGKTFYLTDTYVSDQTLAAGVEFLVLLTAGVIIRLISRVPAGHAWIDHLNTPIKVSAGESISLAAYQWSGGAKKAHGTIIGFEV